MLLLEPHPGSALPGLRIEAEAERREGGVVALRYALSGAIEDVLLPPPAQPERTNGLWRHTCFEGFVRARAEAGYFEINLSPSGQWAVYRFSDYRQDMAAAEQVVPPQIETHVGDDRLELAACIDLGPVLGLLERLPWQLGLAAVVEERGGRLSHWALAHPSGQPDFHHEHCFALELPPPERR